MSAGSAGSSGFPELDDLYGLDDAPRPPVHAPLWPVVAATVAALLSALALPWAVRPEVEQQLWWGALGYVLGALATPLLTVAYRMGRRAARKNPYYVPRPRWERVLVTATVVGIALGILHAWFVATELAKQ